MRLLVDVSQYAAHPAASGVQRVLRHLARDWPGSHVEARFGFLEGGDYLTGPMADFATVVESVFRLGYPASSQVRVAVREMLLDFSDESVRTKDVQASFDAYLLPEPTLQRDAISFAERVVSSRAFFLLYDALPLTHPQFFPGIAAVRAAFQRYYQALAKGENIAFISQHAREVFEGRLARRRVQNGVVVRLGADGLPHQAARATRTPRLVVVGTVEARKRIDLVLDALDELWTEGRDDVLLLLGPRGETSSELVDRLLRLSRSPRVLWLERADDDAVSDALATATAMLFLSDAEGWGLPPLEALHAGCPVIVSAALPALEDLDAAGQIRLTSLGVAEVRSAIEEVTDPERNAELRREIETLRLPTWSDFARTMESWIATTLDAPN